ncbi:MAG: hypothetical protein WA418_19215, partial [Bradyrhizobium sp.]
MSCNDASKRLLKPTKVEIGRIELEIAVGTDVSEQKCITTTGPIGLLDISQRERQKATILVRNKGWYRRCS